MIQEKPITCGTCFRFKPSFPTCQYGTCRECPDQFIHTGRAGCDDHRGWTVAADQPRGAQMRMEDCTTEIRTEGLS